MVKTITKADIIERVYENLGGSKQECARLVELSLELIRQALENGENVKISGFGKFNLRNKRSRPGRNPRNKQEIMITPRRVVTFKASRLLKDQMNRGES